MHYGEGSPQHVRAARSLIAALNSTLHFGGQLRWDADLCLVRLTDTGITYGVVFHADHDNQDHGADGPEPGTWSLHS